MGSRIQLVLSIFISFLALLTSCQSQKGVSKNEIKIPVIPKIEGLNFYTKGGRKGKIFIVKNLNDSGANSFREAVEYDGPRVVLFNISGEINLESTIKIRNPFITVFGQTSPGAGIILKNAGISIQTHDVVLQHITINVGDSHQGPAPTTRDALEILGSQTNFDDFSVGRIIIDHCSISLAIDENLSIWGNVCDVLISNSIVSYGLNKNMHSKGAHSKGILIGKGAKNISINRSILAYNEERNPRIDNDTEVIFVNNLIYNCRYGLFVMDDPKQQQVFYNLYMTNNIIIPEYSEYSVRIRQTNKRTKVTARNNYDNKEFEQKILKKNIITAGNSPINLNIISRDSLLPFLKQNAGSHPASRGPLDEHLMKEIKIKDQLDPLLDCTDQYLVWSEGTIKGINRKKIEVAWTTNWIKSFKPNKFFFSVDGKEKIPIENGQVNFLFLTKAPRLKLGSKFRILSKCESYLNLDQVDTLKRGLNIPASPNGDNNKNGYTNLEDWVFEEY